MPLTKSQKKYCGNQCAAQDRARVRVLDSARSKLSATVHVNVDKDTQETVFSLMGADGAVVLEEIALAIDEKKPLPAPPLRKNLTDSGMDLGAYGIMVRKGKVYRPDDALSYDTIDDMLGCGQVLFALALKQSAIRSVLRNERSWKVICSDSRMQETVRGIMAQVFRRHSKEFLEYMPYGAAFFEKQWDYQAGQNWGLDGVRGKLYGYRDLKAIHPRSIKWIDYKSNGHTFNGFTQERNTRRPPEVHVPTELSLVLSYDKKWRNLWGTPAMEAVYPYWFWLEVATRSFLRYLERTGTPVTVVYAPMRGEITGPDGTRYPSMKYALIQAGYIAKSNAAAFPSDVDPETGNPLWRVEYLADDKRGDQFVKAIEVLGTMITRSLIIGDRAATQGDSAGSYAMAETHLEVTMLHNEMVLDELLEQVNEYLVAPLVRHNGSARTPPAHIETEGLDPAEKQRLFGLINIAGNAAGNALKMVDWRSIFDINNIPALTDEEVEELYEEELERTVKHNETLAATAVDQEPPKKDPPQGQKPVDKIKQSAEYIQHQIVNGAQVPFMVSQEYAVEIVDRYGARPFRITLQETEPDIEAMVEQILQELLSEESEPVSETEIEEVRQAIRAYLLGRTELESDIDYIELGLRDFLSRAKKKISSIANRIVKAVTGRTISQWRSGQKPEPKYKSKAGVVIDKDGRVWREKDHPRESSGRFAKKSSDSADVEPSVEDGKAKESEFLPTRTREEQREKSSLESLSGREQEIFDSFEIGDADQEFVAKIATNLAKYEEQDPWFAEHFDPSKVNIGSEKWVREQYPDAPNLFAAFVTADGQMYIASSSERMNITPDSVSHAVVHEMNHAIDGSWTLRKGSQPGFISVEESGTELMTNRTVGLNSNMVYRAPANAYIAILRDLHGNDRDAIWREIEEVHLSGSAEKTTISMIKRAYPDLNRRQIKQVKQALHESGYDHYSDGMAYGLMTARKLHFQNIRGGNWEQEYGTWVENSVVIMKPFFGYSGYGEDVLWLFEK